jgi:hypothetical protein
MLKGSEKNSGDLEQKNHDFFVQDRRNFAAIFQVFLYGNILKEVNSPPLAHPSPILSHLHARELKPFTITMSS